MILINIGVIHLIESLIDIVIEYSAIFVSFIVGAFLSAVFLIPFEENLLSFLRKRWWLIRKKAVRGTVVKGYFIDRYKQQEEFQKNEIGFIIRGTNKPYRMYYELKLPYPDISTDAMTLERSHDLIRMAYANKYKKDVHVVKAFPLNEVNPRSNIIIRKEDLDMKPPE